MGISSTWAAGLTAVAVLALGGAAQAHTTSLGYTPGATTGSVIIWSGHYNHSGLPPLEGTAYLDGVSLSYSSSAPYSIGPVSTRPAGLVERFEPAPGVQVSCELRRVR